MTDTMDIKLDSEWQLTQAANGDAPVTTDMEGFLQDIRLESMTQEGELFYDITYGWSLLDFIQRENDEMLELELRERIKSKLEKHTQIDIESIEVFIIFKEDVMTIVTNFSFSGADEVYEINAELSRISVEVTDD